MTTGEIAEKAFEAADGYYKTKFQAAADAVTQHEREWLCNALERWRDDDSDERTSEQFLSDLRAGKYHAPPPKTPGQVAQDYYLECDGYVDWETLAKKAAQAVQAVLDHAKSG